VKLSVSLPEEDVATLDDFAAAAGLRSRSAAVQRAIGLLRRQDLEREYEAAWDEWSQAGDDDAWSATAGDGLLDAPR
jgi:Arc/MetJ-type ribon-helix-helix transcriptional regulator